MAVFNKGKWIWPADCAGADTHAEFVSAFDWAEGKTEIKLSCDSDYTLYINGAFVECNQYLDYEHYKIYDEFDVTPYLKKGKNTVAVHVWYFGADTQRYAVAPAGLIYEISCEGQPVLFTDENTLGRRSRAYVSGRQKLITYQLGFSITYDACREDGWLSGEGEGFAPCEVVEKNCTFYPRPNKKLKYKDGHPYEVVEASADGKHYVIDVGEETVGLLDMALTSETDGNHIIVSYGEILVDGHVKRILGPRDFSLDYYAKQGDNEFTHYMLRLGARYLEIDADEPITLTRATLIPQYYPTKMKTVELSDDLYRRMYDLSMRSLSLCMMEHYVDCPWREQALYAFDSRNQMLCGYYGFEDGNFEYVRSNLKLMGIADRINGILPICAPCGANLTIPSFSLYYYLELKEYTEASGDVTLAKELMPTLVSVLKEYLGNMQDGLVLKFAGATNWNFYDWSPYSDGTLGSAEAVAPDVLINVLTVMALGCLERLCTLCGEEYPFAGIKEQIIEKTRKTHFNAEDGLFTMTAGQKVYTEIANSLAVLNGFATKEEAVAIAKRLAEGSLHNCSLSMKVFKYEALLFASEDYSDFILKDLRKDFTVMLDNGATATWETIDGPTAFDDAGSLCHGWTALPVYFLNRLGVIKN